MRKVRRVLVRRHRVRGALPRAGSGAFISSLSFSISPAPPPRLLSINYTRCFKLDRRSRLTDRPFRRPFRRAERLVRRARVANRAVGRRGGPPPGVPSARRRPVRRNRCCSTVDRGVLGARRARAAVVRGRRGDGDADHRSRRRRRRRGDGDADHLSRRRRRRRGDGDADHRSRRRRRRRRFRVSQ